MEECRAERLLEARWQQRLGTFRNGSKVEEQHETHDGYAEVANEDAHLFVLEEDATAADAHVVIEREVDAADHHEQASHIFYIAAVEVGYALRMGAETTRRYRRESMTDSIVEAHRSEPIGKCTDAGQHHIDEQHTPCRSPYLRAQLVEPKACHLCRIEVAVLHLIDRDEGKGEDHDAEASYPLGNGSPEEQAFRQGVNVVDAGGTRRSEAAHRLEESTRHVHVRQAEVRHHADDGEDYPRECHDEEVVGPSHPSALPVAAQEDAESTQGYRSQSREQEAEPALFAVEDSDRHREQQEEALHDDEDA